MTSETQTTTTKSRATRAHARGAGLPPTPTVITPAASPEFRWDDRPVSTAFYRRFTAMLERAFSESLWIVLCGQPGDGKSTAIEGFLARHPRRETIGETEVPVFATRVPQGPKTALALMLAFAADLGRVPHGQKGTRLQRWLFDTAVGSGVRLIIIDDAHELSMVQLNWLREFTGSLALVSVRPGLVLSAAIRSDDTSRLPLWALISAMSDFAAKHRTGSEVMKKLIPADEERLLTAWQFSRRLDGPRPLVHVLAHTDLEVREIVAAWERRYKSKWPTLNLRRWSDSLATWCRDGRIDVAGFHRVCVNSLAQIVKEGLQAEIRAGGDGSGEDLGARLRSAAIRQMSRGMSYAAVDGDPLRCDLHFIQVDADPGPEDSREST